MLACFESLIGIGLFVSGVFLLGIASYLLSQEIISSTQLAITAAGGAILGDHVGFFFGRFLGPRLHHTRLFIRHADRILKTEDMIARWGGIAVPIGRFVPAIRSIVPALLGDKRIHAETLHPHRHTVMRNMGGRVGAAGNRNR